MDNTKIKRVHVVYKTHLDLGFTAMAADVLETYRHEFIPRALDTAEKMNRDGKRKFIWTTGSWLIEDYLTHMPAEQAARMDAAIRRGDITWHALAYTTYSELMDETLLRYNLSISRKLCERYGKTVCAAKQTDVPGHTIAMIPEMAKAGVKYMHIGINGASRPVAVPPMFRWQYGGEEIIIDYSPFYGAVSMVEGCDEVMEFAHSKDNMGPPTAEEVDEILAEMQEKYPNAVIEASTMDAFYQAIAPFRDRLPVVTDEIGDTWIHGVGTDPYKVSAMRSLLALRRDWIACGKLEEDGPQDRGFLDGLLLITEHTWGMDFKKYLYDFKNWERRDFEAARKKDVTGREELSAAGPFLEASVGKEHRKYTGGKLMGSYSLFEKSQQEQRDYLKQAVKGLPEALQPEALAAIQVPVFEKFPAVGKQAEFHIAGAEIHVEEDGAITVRDHGAAPRMLGRFHYEVFDWETVNRCYYVYGRDFDETRGWAEPDFSKPGLDAVENLKRSSWTLHCKSAELVSGDTLRIVCEMSGEAVDRFGCPAEVEYLWKITPLAWELTMRWRDKKANRIPEALWLGFELPAHEDKQVGVQKIGHPVDPFAVVAGGARKLHGCEAVLLGGKPEIVNWDAPLVCLGERALYDVEDDYPARTNMAEFLLFNNRWGTNFKMWYEDDAAFRFTIRR